MNDFINTLDNILQRDISQEGLINNVEEILKSISLSEHLELHYNLSVKALKVLFGIRNEIQMNSNVKGSSTDMHDSIFNSVLFVEEHPYADITFVGHSKGGAEASANAIATNKNAIVFNPARVSIDANGLDSANYSGSVTAYVVVGDILNSTEGKLINPFGNINYLPQQYPIVNKDHKPNVNNMISNHLMDAVIKAIEQKGIYDMFKH